MSCHEADNNSPKMNGQVLTTPQWNRARKLTIHQFMPRGARPTRNLVVGRRLKLARMALGWAEKQGKFAQMAGISLTAYNQWESGENYPGVDNAIKLCDRHTGLTLDWIFRGKLEGMPSQLSNTIQVLADAYDATPARVAMDPQPEMKVVKVPKKPRRKSA